MIVHCLKNCTADEGLIPPPPPPAFPIIGTIYPSGYTYIPIHTTIPIHTSIYIYSVIYPTVHISICTYIQY
jgi:hypothetical protein